MAKNPTKRPSRPVGTLRKLNLLNVPGAAPVVLPDIEHSLAGTKEEAELAQMATLFGLLKGGHSPYIFSKYRKHAAENGPDFDVVWRGKTAFVEAVEYAPLSGPYSTAGRVFEVGEMALHISQLVWEKNEKYKSRGYLPIFLLVHVTHDAFYWCEEVQLMVAQLLQKGPPLIFEAVFALSRWASGEGHYRMPYPHKVDLTRTDLSELARYQVINPDVAAKRVVASDGTSVTLRQYLPSGADLRRLAPSIAKLMPELQRFLDGSKNDASGPGERGLDI